MILTAHTVPNRLDRTVAIKVLPEHLADDPKRRERFELRGLRQNHRQVSCFRSKKITMVSVACLVVLISTFGLGQPVYAETGFTVNNGRLVDANGNDFVVRGVSHPHTWFPGETGAFADIKSLGANTVRVVLSSGQRWQPNSVSDVANVVSLCKQNRLICVLEVHDTTGFGQLGAAATLDQAVDYWISILSVLTGEESYILTNIGNEPYGNDQQVNNWASAASSAINRLRDAGFDHSIVVDAPNWGQDGLFIMRDNAASVFASDPDANTLFSIHMYGVFSQASTVNSYLNTFVNAGLPIMICEFGHLHFDGDPDENTIMATAESLGIGYIGWSWDGNHALVGYLDMVNNFTVTSLTSWGQRIFNGANGIAQTAQEASVYSQLALPAGNPFAVVERGGISLASQGGADTIVTGYGRIQPASGSTAPSGLALFGFRQNGVLVTEAGVPPSPLVMGGRIYAEVSGPVNTGLAIANPNNLAATIDFFFTDVNGTDFGSGNFILGANEQTAQFLDQDPFNSGTSVLGTFTFTSSVPTSVVALRGFTNELSEFLITTLPVADLQATSTETVFFPRFADGGGWTTQLVLLNPTDTTIGGTVEFFEPDGDPSSLMVEDQIGSSFPYSIPARTSQRLRTSGAGATTQASAVRISPSAGDVAPSGLAVFSFKTNGITVAESGVPAFPTGSAFRMYAEASGTFGDVGSIQTGVAIANPGSTTTTVTFDLTQLDGTTIGLTGTATVPGQGQVALFLNQIQGFESLVLPFQGVLRVSTGSQSGVSVAGLRGRYNERGDFLITTTPPVDEAGASTTAEFLFPHFADSGGYTTQFILFSGLPGQTSSGTLRFFNASGEALDLALQ